MEQLVSGLGQTLCSMVETSGRTDEFKVNISIYSMFLETRVP